MSVKALVFWVDDRKTSVVDIGAVPECDRDSGKLTKVVWQDGSSYPAQILKIAKCPKTLVAAEEKFLKKYNSLSGESKRLSKQPLDSTVATAIQVAKALGERIELPPQQAAEKSAILQQRRIDNSNMKQVESTSDELAFKSSNVSHAKRNLMSGFGSSPVKASGHDASPLRLEEVSPDKTCKTPLKEMNSCDRCRSLTNRINPAAMEFLLTLNSFCNLAPVSPSLDSMDAGPAVTLSEGSQLQPLMIESGHKKVELSSGSGLYVKKASKAKAVFSAAGDPEKLTREILAVLYGEKLRQPGISALGNGRRKLGIGENDLQNIFSFVCRNAKVTERKDKKGSELPDFTFNVFIKVVNKKLKSASRDRTNDVTSSSKAKNSSSIQETPLRDSAFATPICVGTPVKSWIVKGSSSAHHELPSTPLSRTSPNWNGIQPSGFPQPASASQPSASQPSASQPSASQPSASQPSASQPSASQPSASQPSASQPSASQPSAFPQPAFPQPASASQASYPSGFYQPPFHSGYPQPYRQSQYDFRQSQYDYPPYPSYHQNYNYNPPLLDTASIMEL